MRALLDTHAFIWWVTDDNRLSSTARNIITHPENILFLSAASAWEIVIKVRLGKLNLPEPPEIYIPSRLTMNRFESLPIEMTHALQVINLPNLHQDPFDRILIAQSQVEEMPIISIDSKIVLQWHENGLDFADAFHLAQSQNHTEFYTFDEKFVKKSKGLTDCEVKLP